MEVQEDSYTFWSKDGESLPLELVLLLGSPAGGKLLSIRQPEGGSGAFIVDFAPLVHTAREAVQQHVVQPLLDRLTAVGREQVWQQEAPLLRALREAYEAGVPQTVGELCQAAAVHDPGRWPACVAEWVLPEGSARGHLSDILLGPRMAQHFGPGAALARMVVRERRWCEPQTRVSTESSRHTPMETWHPAARATLGTFTVGLSEGVNWAASKMVERQVQTVELQEKSATETVFELSNEGLDALLQAVQKAVLRFMSHHLGLTALLDFGLEHCSVDGDRSAGAGGEQTSDVTTQPAPGAADSGGASAPTAGPHLAFSTSNDRDSQIQLLRRRIMALEVLIRETENKRYPLRAAAERAYARYTGSPAGSPQEAQAYREWKALQKELSQLQATIQRQRRARNLLLSDLKRLERSPRHGAVLVPHWLQGGDGLEALTAEDVQAVLAQLQLGTSNASGDSSGAGGCASTRDEGVGGQAGTLLVSRATVCALVNEHFEMSHEACRGILAELMGPGGLAAACTGGTSDGRTGPLRVYAWGYTVLLPAELSHSPVDVAAFLNSALTAGEVAAAFGQQPAAAGLSPASLLRALCNTAAEAAGTGQAAAKGYLLAACWLAPEAAAAFPVEVGLSMIGDLKSAGALERAGPGSVGALGSDAPIASSETVAALQADNPLCQTPCLYIGGRGGDEYWVQENGTVATKLEGWGEACIRGLRITLSNGATHMFGSQIGKLQIIDLAGKVVRRASLHGNGIGTRLGRIRLWLEGEEKEHSINMDNNNSQEYSAVVGSGLIVGCIVRAGSDIDALGLVFLRPIAAVRGRSEWGTPYSPSRTLQSVTGLNYLNDAKTEVSFPQREQVETIVRTKREFTWHVGLKMSYELETSWEAGVPDQFKAEVKQRFGFSLDMDTGGSIVEEREVTKTRSWEWNVVVQPGEHFDQGLYLENCSSMVPYRANVQLQTDRGAWYFLPQKGVYHLTNATRYVVVNGSEHRPKPGREEYQGTINVT